MKSCFLLILLLGFSFQFMAGQQNYELTLKKDGPLVVSSIILLSAEYHLERRLIPLTYTQVQELKIDQLNRFDRLAVQYNSQKADKRSGIGFYSSIALGAGMVMTVSVNSSGKFYQQLPKMAAIFLETNVINYGIANVVKNLGVRARPYVYNTELEFMAAGKNLPDARKSFYSGRTATTAANSFFMAKVFSDFFPESRWQPVVWSLAAFLPAWTGVERVISGQHFPTDVIVGYTIGALCGYFVPHMHRRSHNEKLLHIIPGIGKESSSLTFYLKI
jgi:membrane-associated phospholipid phosphatase